MERAGRSTPALLLLPSSLRPLLCCSSSNAASLSVRLRSLPFPFPSSALGRTANLLHSNSRKSIFPSSTPHLQHTQHTMQTTKALLLAAAAATTCLLHAEAFMPLPSATKYANELSLPVPLRAMTATSLQPRTGAIRPLSAAGDGSGETTYKIQVTGNNIEVTPAMREYVEKKIGKVLSKLPLHDAINKVDVHLSVVLLAQAVKHSHTAEATLFMKGGQVLRASEETDYMYASIDLVSHRITRLLRKFKDRKLGKRKEVNFEEDGEAEMEALSEAMAAGGAGEGSFQDPAKGVNMEVVKTKQFDMPAMSTADAIVCLDYIGHDFYVYRNEKSNEINVVYKRKQGGVGVIEPRK